MRRYIPGLLQRYLGKTNELLELFLEIVEILSPYLLGDNHNAVFYDTTGDSNDIRLVHVLTITSVFARFLQFSSPICHHQNMKMFESGSLKIEV